MMRRRCVSGRCGAELDRRGALYGRYAIESALFPTPTDDAETSADMSASKTSDGFYMQRMKYAQTKTLSPQADRRAFGWRIGAVSDIKQRITHTGM